MISNIVLGDYAIGNEKFEIVSITESIYSQIVRGSIILEDYNIINQTIKPELYNINFFITDTANETQSILGFIVDDIGDTIYDLTNRLSNMKNIRFSSYYSPTLFSNKNLNLKNKSSLDMLKSIFNEYNITQDFKNISSKIDKTSKWNYISPNIPLHESIDYIVTRTTDTNKNGGFLLFQDIYTNKFNLYNYDDLYNDKVLGFYKYPLISDAKNDEYLGNILSFRIVNEYNLTELIEKGIDNKSFVGFDTKTGNVINSSTNLKLVSQKNKLQGYFPFAKDFKFSKKYDYRGLQQSTNIIENISYTNNIDSVFDNIVIEVAVKGDYERRLGQKIGLVVNEVNNGDSLNAYTPDLHYTGEYLITDIEHKFYKDGNYEQILILKKPTFNFDYKKNYYKIT